MKRIAIARFAHEGNSFASVKTELADFQAGEWATGAAVPQAYHGTNTEIGGAAAFLAERREWQPRYLRAAFATPSGEVTRAAFETILDEIVGGLAAAPNDAVYLAQHGAMQVEGVDHADLEILKRVRAAIGTTPLGVSYDLHANITQELLDLADVSIGYKCHPHTDMAETARKCLGLLFDKISGRIDPVHVVVPMNALIPSINARTTDGPMAEAAAFARGLAAGGGLLDVTLYQGYAYGDRAHAGASAVVVADRDRAAATRAAEAAVAEMHRIRDRLFIAMPDAASGIARGLAEARAGRGPVAVIDAADHPGAGANADTPDLLRALVAAQPDIDCAFVFFWDPGTVAQAIAAGIGGRFEAALGGRLTGDFGPPVRLDVTVERITDGQIVHTGPVYHGLALSYGRTAVLRHGRIRIAVTEICQMVTDPSFFALHGIDLASLGVLAIKAKNQFRAAFAGSFASMIDVDVPGPAAYDFARLPWRRIPKTHFPFAR